MPTPYVRKLAKKHKTTVKKSEKEWEKAKKQAAKQGKGDNFAYITGIYKRIMGEKSMLLNRVLSRIELAWDPKAMMAMMEEAKPLLLKIAKGIGLTNCVKKGATYQLKGNWNGHQWYSTMMTAFDARDQRLGFIQLNIGTTDFKYGDKKGAAWKIEFEKNLVQQLKKVGVTITKHSSTGTKEFMFQLPSFSSRKDLTETGHRPEEPPLNIEKYKAKILQEVKAKGWSQLKFGKEFIENSFAFAKDSTVLQYPEQAQREGIQLYDSPDVGYGGRENKVYWSEKLGLFWLNTGSFD